MPGRSRLTVVLNRESGTVSSIGADVVRDGLQEIFAQAGCQVRIHSVSAARIRATLEEARDDESDAVIVGGGDGTVASAATLFAGRSKPLGILPLGTFNLAARDVGMPLDWKQAASALLTAPETRMDLLDVDGGLSLCVIVLGFYPALMMGRPEYHGNWVVKAFRTLRDGFRSAMTFPPLDLEMHEQETGEVRRHRTRMVILANNEYEEMFGIIPKRRSLNAGYFTVYVSRHSSRSGMIRSVLNWILGRWKQDREVSSFHATSLRIVDRRSRSLAVMRDGEVERMKLPLQIRILPEALRIIAPRIAEEESATVLPPTP